ncbi:MAG: ribonuclease P protein component [Bacteroidales bacterium]|nr:ribonuclease P protein component [Bacteroidales bacterium]
MTEEGRHRETFRKAERLCGETTVGAFFAARNEGSGVESFVKYPLLVGFRVVEKRKAEEASCRMLISVGKKRFKRAVKRNRVKRLVREAYRKEKWRLEEEMSGSEGKTLQIAYSFVGKELPTQEDIDKSIRVSVERMLKSIEQKKRG